MARPVEFDPDAALEAAIEVFSDHGYEGSSTTALLARMGIARQSLYCAFGDKRRLFLKALERHVDDSLAEMARALRSTDGHIEALEAALLAFAGPAAGCLGLGAVTEFGRSDPQINAVNDAGAQAMRSLLAAHLRAGMAAGEIGEVDAEAAAGFLLAVRAGLKIAARNGAPPDELRSTARMALRGLRARS
ncbi:TetR/AcrR family transcriptional regulator [Phenylobacterium sp.]|uniref:TetR/AcrR family transcriptional regulator n=1 Tax=Phenylobacterium sp. TaxID=1871053 RepID=UPI0035ADE999